MNRTPIPLQSNQCGETDNYFSVPAKWIEFITMNTVMASKTIDEVMSEDDRQALLDTIQRRECVLLLGPDAARPGSDEAQSLSIILADQLISDMHGGGKIASSYDLAHVSQVYLNQTHKGQGHLVTKIKRFYDNYADTTTNLHSNLAALPFQIVITTTPDSFMQNAFLKNKKSPCRGLYSYRQSNSKFYNCPSEKETENNVSDQRPLIYELFGGLDDLQSLVTTQNQIIEFLVHIIKHPNNLPSIIRKVFTDSETSFLFVGFGFQNWYLRILLHVLRGQSSSYLALALEKPDFLQDDSQEETILFFSSEYSIQFKNTSWNEFSKKLLEQYKESNPNNEKFQENDSKISVLRPRAFLCYSSEDEINVSRIAEKLREHGIDIWQDIKDLRGGDQWANKILEVIEKEMDYFLIMCSSNSNVHKQSFINQEINSALATQKQFPPSSHFLIPIIISHCEKREELEKIQHINLTDDEGNLDLNDTETFLQLINTIKDDWKKRTHVG